MVDVSGSVSQLSFQKQNVFLKTLVEVLNIGPESTNTGLIVFSYRASVHQSFQVKETSSFLCLLFFMHNIFVHTEDFM